jgi:hypothetical protein
MREAIAKHHGVFEGMRRSRHSGSSEVLRMADCAFVPPGQDARRRAEPTFEGPSLNYCKGRRAARAIKGR